MFVAACVWTGVAVLSLFMGIWNNERRDIQTASTLGLVAGISGNLGLVCIILGAILS